jgi:hypothetical protein
MDPMGTAINAATKWGLVTAVSTGNLDRAKQIGIPACASTAVAVAAVYSADVGKQPWKNSATGLDCVDATTKKDQVTCFSNRCDPLLDHDDCLLAM